MKRSAFALTIFVCCVATFAGNPPKRPRIFGIAKVQLVSTNLPNSHDFYSRVFKIGQPTDCDWCERIPSNTFSVNIMQQVMLSAAPAASPSNLIEEITFATDNIRDLRRYLNEKKIQISDSRENNKPIGPFLSVVDPEGHRISFIQSLGVTALKPGYPPEPPSNLRLIHVGIIVHDQAAEDHFYKDILGFHVYWHGGMKDGEDHWVDMQVPDGTDWIEYMLNVPANADHHTLGVMNHIALGVPDIKAAREQLIKSGWTGSEQPKIGRDGKWQLNLYDPDDTRVELMEFTPTQKPCCSEYTGPHPGPKQ
jgi:catechol 2,3-dioxygenase-like lactoylglutathione lyase family enzyme/predicted enzyme related to lactoylglutathione lyase